MQANLDAGSVPILWMPKTIISFQHCYFDSISLAESSFDTGKFIISINYSTIVQSSTYFYTVTNSGNVNVNGPIKIIDSLITGII